MVVTRTHPLLSDFWWHQLPLFFQPPIDFFWEHCVVSERCSKPCLGDAIKVQLQSIPVTASSEVMLNDHKYIQRG